MPDSCARYRPIARTDRIRPPAARLLAGGWAWFSECERLSCGEPSRVVSADDLPPEVLDSFCRRRKPICGVSTASPVLMGVLNVTPDSFSDGGDFTDPASARERARELAKNGAAILDIGGESTRPGAGEVDADEEIRRTVPVIRALRDGGHSGPISIDTRKAAVANAALDAGADMVNDVSALEFDDGSLGLAADRKPFVCLMHSRGDPRTMQDNPVYDDVLLDICDYLETRVNACLRAGIPSDRIVVDPGIGFGKTLDQNLELIRGLSMFHCFGCPVLVGVSRKRFVGALGSEPDPRRRFPGSMAVALEALRQGVQIIRVHDIAESRQAVALWRAML